MTQKKLLNLLQLVETVDEAGDVDEVVSALCRSLELYGFDACLITNLPMRRRDHWHEHILANRWPEEWFIRYNASGHYRHDPCVTRCCQSAAPFTWSDVRQESLEDAAIKVMEEAHEFGLLQGICVPLHTPFAPPAVVSIAGENSEIAQQAISSLSIIARHALETILRFLLSTNEPPQSHLSRREREVLQWIAEGKTAWEVSRILSLSEHTVLTHQRNAKQKLGAANTVHAVVKAFLRHEIHP
ncbi:helix-turn-helix transcriptional regulator [Paracoccus onubensis]|uniref:HTH luxR-type domain-containing protein n=1 Tax=Paracoccus onubensis TaxID=1675788 RepID=A0A418T1X4_9RHOB|nr:LuxR family transcriptional regulator [Paracoccus onubensis]RJE87212.1 hypothetical protein D3P04_05560 [Paracoccus onubensis]